MERKNVSKEVLSINFEKDLKNEMAAAAKQRGMEMSQLHGTG
ncbi:MAG: hypothetical protein ACOYL3_25230 [Desulfuromonadaceae bacterium]